MKIAIRGSVLTYNDNPFVTEAKRCIYYAKDAIVAIEDGLIVGLGEASEMLTQLSDDTTIIHYQDALILPGFIDCHVHYPQTEIIGAYGKQLIDWLNKYTFVAEQHFQHKAHASEIAKVFLRECLRAGTTTTTTFCTVHPVSVDAFFEESEKLNMRNIAGKVLMDRNAPKALTDTAKTGYDQTKSLIARWHGRGRQLYCVTPRFAPTSSAEQMEMTGAVWQEHPGTFLQSHVSETQAEIAWVKELYPERKSYVDVYDHYGQLGPRAILGHGVHLSEDEFQRLHDTGTAISHCPTSNLFLGSGLFNLKAAMHSTRPIRVGLGTDLGAGTNFSLLVTMSEAYKVAQLNGYSLSALHAFYLITKGAAHALYLDDKIGSLSIGKEADITVLDLKATPLIEHRLQYVKDIEEMLFVLMTLGDDRTVQATYIAGECLYSRESGSTTGTFHTRLSTT